MYNYQVIVFDFCNESVSNTFPECTMWCQNTYSVHKVDIKVDCALNLLKHDKGV